MHHVVNWKILVRYGPFWKKWRGLYKCSLIASLVRFPYKRTSNDYVLLILVFFTTFFYSWSGLIKALNLCRRSVYCWALCLVMQNSRNKTIELRNTSVHSTTKKREKRKRKLDTRESRKLKSGAQWGDKQISQSVKRPRPLFTTQTELNAFSAALSRKRRQLWMFYSYRMPDTCSHVMIWDHFI